MAATKAALDLAGLIHEKLSQAAPVETLKLQKLMYYCNAWNLALRDEPMFLDEIQAWKHGPVVASLYGYHRGSVVIQTWAHGSGAEVPQENQALALEIIDLYGGRSGWALRELTHTEAPWQEAWNASDQGRVRGFEISHASMREYYKKELRKVQA